ncbi:1495_t:CDS:2 [Cetraspora pellucida]|uniref:1495_t:CDS:1 n=1 Tax=Cetraspora pellucida TaxID=1433469 RepID=A0A9N9EU00_9GLOM|nr:1495_t:CDS:2 [Cetraspora pellucida]
MSSKIKKTTLTNEQKLEHGIANVKLHREDASVDHDTATESIPKLRQLLLQYHSQDIYNIDETALNSKSYKAFKDLTTAEEPDDSVEIYQFTHQEALDALNIVNQDLLKQNNDMTKYISILLKITKKVRSLRTASLQQTNLELFFALNSVKNNMKVEYDYLTNFDMFEADKDTEIEDLKLEK